MKCTNCGIDFNSKRVDAKFCSPKCRLEAFRKQSVETDNVTLSEPVETDIFKFNVMYNKEPGDKGYDPDIAKERKRVRTATYWYDVPLAAQPIKQKDWPKMPDYMNGRQYFLWWKNEFELKNDIPVILNPFN